MGLQKSDKDEKHNELLYTAEDGFSDSKKTALFYDMWLATPVNLY